MLGSIDNITTVVEVIKFLNFLDGFVSGSTDTLGTVFGSVAGSLTGSGAE